MTEEKLIQGNLLKRKEVATAFLLDKLKKDEECTARKQFTDYAFVIKDVIIERLETYMNELKDEFERL